MILPVTLMTAAAAALLNIWLMMRIGKLRQSAKVLHGDGGNAQLTKRMRAQLNFIESVVFVLVLIAAIEISGSGGAWLSLVAAAYILGRIAHVFGMEHDTPHALRIAGTAITMLTLLGLAIAAVLVVFGVL